MPVLMWLSNLVILFGTFEILEPVPGSAYVLEPALESTWASWTGPWVGFRFLNRSLGWLVVLELVTEELQVVELVPVLVWGSWTGSWLGLRLLNQSLGRLVSWTGTRVGLRFLSRSLGRHEVLGPVPGSPCGSWTGTWVNVRFLCRLAVLEIASESVWVSPSVLVVGMRFLNRSLSQLVVLEPAAFELFKLY